MLRFIATHHLENGIQADEYADDFFELAFFRSGILFIGFQLIYDRRGRQRVLTWDAHRGYSHYEVVYPNTGAPISTPVLVDSSAFPKKPLLEHYDEACLSMPQSIRVDVRRKIAAYHRDTSVVPQKPTPPREATSPIKIARRRLAELAQTDSGQR